MAVLLLLCGELAAWSLDERLGIEAEPSAGPAARSGGGDARRSPGSRSATLVVALSAVGPSHGLGWTVLGAAAALAAAGTGIWVAHR